MPTYTFVKKDDEEEKEPWEELMTIAEMEQYLKDNPDVRQIIGAPPLGDPHHLMRHKPDQGFRDVLKHIKRSHRRAKVNTFD